MSGRTSSEPAAPPPGEPREALRARLVARIPSWYRPWAHVAIPSLIGIGMAVTALCLLHHVQLWQLSIVPAAFVLINATEWRLHRDLLHKRKIPFQLLYDRHTPEHHMVYLTDDMAMRSNREFRMVLIPGWAIPAAFFGAAPIPAVLALCGQWNLAMLFIATAMLYVVGYEQLHLSYHLPADSFIGRRKLVAFLRRHHATHHSPHLMQRWNFNVTIPLWDLVRGTIYKPGCETRDSTIRNSGGSATASPIDTTARSGTPPSV